MDEVIRETNMDLFQTDEQAELFIRQYLFVTSLKAPEARGLAGKISSVINDLDAEINEIQVQGLNIAFRNLTQDVLDKLASDPAISNNVKDIFRIRFVQLFANIQAQPQFAILVPAYIGAISAGYAAVLQLPPITDFIPVASDIFKNLPDKVQDKSGGFQYYDIVGLTSTIAVFKSNYSIWDTEQTTDKEAQKELIKQAQLDKEEREGRILSSFGLRETAEAEERLQALLGHMNDPHNIDHYRFAIWNERSAASLDSDITMMLALKGFIDPTPVGSVGDTLALPVRLKPGTDFHTHFDEINRQIKELAETETRTHILPAPALYSEAIVGECSSAEQEAVERLKLEMRRLELDNQLEALEAERLRARLNAVPPLLNKELPTGARVDVSVGESAEKPEQPKKA